MRLLLFSMILCLYQSITLAQMADTSPLPYQRIPDPPADYSSGNILARMIDGLGFRYYWATEGLTETDLAYTPSEGSQNTLETLVHIYGLSETIVNAPQNQPNIRSADWSQLSFDTLRQRTLANFEKASALCQGKTEEEIAEFTIIFQRGEQRSQYPYWNMMNGPLADAIYHVGQIVVFRRAAGNPINPKVNVFLGRTDL